jgi:hypothetical protein
MTHASLFALDRDQAKQLFAQRQPELLAAWLAGLAAEPERAAGKFDLGDQWQQLQAELGEEYPLAQALSGGRPLPGDDDWTAAVVRPDTVGHIAEALPDAPPASLGPDAWQQLRSFYTQAASLGQAVLFVVDRRG